MDDPEVDPVPDAPPALPKRIVDRFGNVNVEIETLLKYAEEKYTPTLPPRIRFRLTNSAPTDVLDNERRAALHAFLAKLKGIPECPQPVVVQRDDKYYLGNEDNMRHILAEYRPIIFNQKDPIFHTRIQSILVEMLDREHPGDGTKVVVLSGEEDVTASFKGQIVAARKVLNRAVARLDLDFLYNGVLQHSDPKFHGRYEEEFNSGELSYVVLKNAMALSYLRRYLRALELGASAFWVSGYPKRGGL